VKRFSCGMLKRYSELSLRKSSLNILEVYKLLTICLVTQGREQVRDFLESAAPFVDLDYVNFLVIDNGAPLHISEILEAWSSVQPRTTYVRREENTTDFNEMWELIEEHSSEWINFPGDDDRLVLKGYKEFYNLVTHGEGIDAIAMSANIIDSQGKSTGEKVSPNFNMSILKCNQVGLALNSPPFFWPALFINKNLIHSPFPKSRFVLDWWISLQLVVHGNVTVSDECSLEYRRHSSQESAQVALNRKFFEASYHFDELLNAEKFNLWLNSLGIEERLSLWESATKNLPIYGDREFGKLILFRLAKMLINSSPSNVVRSKVLSDISQFFGVFYHDGSLSEILSPSKHFEQLLGNVRLSNNCIDCPHLEFVLSSFVGNQNAIAVEISCVHMKGGPESIHLDCNHYEYLTYSQKTDRLVVEIATELELQGKIEFRISPRERALINLLRRIKPMISGRLLMKIKKAT
jgi:hypothetical protein